MNNIVDSLMGLFSADMLTTNDQTATSNDPNYLSLSGSSFGSAPTTTTAMFDTSGNYVGLETIKVEEILILKGYVPPAEPLKPRFDAAGNFLGFY